MKRSSWFILLILIVSMFSLTLAATERDCVYYFYGEECTSCQSTETFLNKLEQKNPELTLERLESYHNQDNAQLLRQYFIAYQIPELSQGVPIAFLANSYLVGGGPIEELLEERIKDNLEVACPSLMPGKTIGIVGDKEPRHIIETLTFSLVLGEALQDTFSSIMLILLVVLLGVILKLRSFNQLIEKGLLFISGVLLASFMFALGWLPQLGKGIVFSKMVAAIVLVVSILEIRIFLKKKMVKPSSEKMAQIKKYLFSLPGVFTIGFLTSLFTVSALGETFQMLGEFSQHSYTSGVALPLLLFFLIVLVIPQLIVVVVSRQLWQQFLTQAHEKAKVEVHFSKWRDHFKKVMNFIVAIITLLFSILVLFL